MAAAKKNTQKATAPALSPVDEVLAQIARITDPADLARIKHRVDWQIKNSMKRSFRKGSLVAFDARGGTITGTVDRVNSKTVSVSDCFNSNGVYSYGYRVSPTILRDATAAEAKKHNALLEKHRKNSGLTLVDY